MPDFSMTVNSARGSTDFTCDACGARFTVVRSPGDELLYYACPCCQEELGLQKVMASLAISEAPADVDALTREATDGAAS